MEWPFNLCMMGIWSFLVVILILNLNPNRAFWSADGSFPSHNDNRLTFEPIAFAPVHILHEMKTVLKEAGLRWEHWGASCDCVGNGLRDFLVR